VVVEFTEELTVEVVRKSWLVLPEIGVRDNYIIILIEVMNIIFKLKELAL